MPMPPIPRPVLALGLAGLLPFVWSALTAWHPGLGDWSTAVFGPRLTGPYAGLSYGIVILSFMSGVLWGFATRASGGRAVAAYGLSVVPALWTFLMVGGGTQDAAAALIAGFAGLLLLDRQFVQWGLAPGWWMPLRLMLTAVVCLSLLPIVL